jgi:hypothetical protein
MIKTIDYFAAPMFSHSSDALYKARLLVGILFAYICIVLGLATYLFLLSFLPSIAVMAALILLVPIFFFYVISLWVLRFKGAYVFSAQGVVATSFLGIMAGVCVSGGPIETPAEMILVMPSILAFCLLGLRVGLFWTTLLFLTNLFGIALGFSGFEYLQVSPPEMDQVNRVFNWRLAFLSIVSIVIIYEHMNTRLKHELDAERERYKQWQHMIH